VSSAGSAPAGAGASRLSWTGWTFCHQGPFPALATRCRLRVRVGVAVIEEVVAYYDPVAWRLAE
jgi:hypothetical protein